MRRFIAREPIPAISVDEAAEIYRSMRLIRRFDEECLRLVEDGVLPGAVHPYTGQEAVAVGICAALTDSDRVASTHRGHGHTLAKGADPARMMAELFGRSDGYCLGLGGSMHIADFDIGMLGANGIVGAGLSIAAGAALAAQLAGGTDVAVCFFGDGAVGAGGIHEVLNLASLWGLPLLLVCENNGWASGNTPDEVIAAKSLASVALPHGVRTASVDGNDVLAVRSVALEAVERARSGAGPMLIEALTYRMGVHAMSPARRLTRIAIADRTNDLRAWAEQDPLVRFRVAAFDAELLDPDRVRRIDDDVENVLSAAVRFGQASPVASLATAQAAFYA